MSRDAAAYEFLLDCSSDAILRIGPDRRYCYANPAASRILGLDVREMVGRPVTDLVLAEEVMRVWDDAIRAAFDRAEHQSVAFHCSLGLRSVYLQARVLPEMDAAGKIVSALAVIHDMSKRERMEKEHEDLLTRERSARVQAETAARARDEFLAVVSHELRAPLNGIQTWAHILENQFQGAAYQGIAQRAIAGIRTGVSQQVRLIEDLLDVTRMMSGKLRLIKQPFAVLHAVEAAVQSVTDAASAKRVEIECDCRIGEETIEGDADRIQQVLWNLLANAVKFTPQGGRVRVTAHSTESHVLISVMDTGIGISADFLPLLFDRFSQEDTSSTRRHNGLGLGLFLVRHLVEMHGGTVKAESAGDQQGATFSVELPLRSRRKRMISALQPDVGDHAGPLPSLQGQKILLVDDQPEARESLSLLLTAAGASVFSASSTAEIFDWLGSLPEERFPNVLISDIAMPVEDGYTVLRKVRAWKDMQGKLPFERLPALALTAFAQREDRIRALTAGFQMHVAKPVAPEELIIVLATITSR